MEIERKWRVHALPAEVAGWPARRIEQGYLAVTAEAEVRLRRRGEQHLLTVKSAPGLVRVEEELPIDRGAFERLWPLTVGRRVLKARHARREGDVLLEVDVFEGALAGLVTLEVEFPDVGASETFVPPRWAGPELTGDLRWSNQTLAVRGLPDE